MRSEQGERERSRRRTGRRLGHAATVLLALVLAGGCGAPRAEDAPVGSVGGAAPAPVDDSVRTVPRASAAPAPVPGPGAGRYNPRQAALPTLPGELVGSWSGDDPQGVGSWTVEFATDGRYAEHNVARGFTVSGQALVSGSRLYLQPKDADGQTVTWRVDRDRLDLDGQVYLRTRYPRQR